LLLLLLLRLQLLLGQGNHRPQLASEALLLQLALEPQYALLLAHN